MRRWPQRDEPHAYLPLETRTLRGKRVGLHGFGSIARELVGMLRAFGVEISSYSWGVPTGLFERYGVRECGSLQELFSGSDVLIECEALTAHNQGTVNAAMLRRLPAGAVFINVGRGHVVDETALVQVAAEKGLRLGLDVYCEEPLPASSPLRALPRRAAFPAHRRTRPGRVRGPVPVCAGEPPAAPARRAHRGGGDAGSLRPLDLTRGGASA